jgi:hypothetical protein
LQNCESVNDFQQFYTFLEKTALKIADFENPGNIGSGKKKRFLNKLLLKFVFLFHFFSMLRSLSNLSHGLVAPIEELSRQENSVGQCLDVACFRTLADRLWAPFHIICFNPIIAICVFLLIYVIFNILFLPLWVLSFLITSYGSLAIFLVLFHFLIIFIIRMIAFPGANISTQKQLAQDFLKRLLMFIENVAVSSNQYSSTLMLIANGQLPIQELYMNMNELQKILITIEYLPNILTYLKDTMDYLKGEKLLNGHEMKCVQDLYASIEHYYQSFHYLYHFLNEEYYNISSHHHVINANHQFVHHQQKNNRVLLTNASKCLKSSEVMRLSCLSLKPKGSSPQASSNNNNNDGHGTDDDDDNDEANTASLNAVVKLVSSFLDNVHGFEHITLPYMRSILQHKYDAKNYLIKGSNDNLIDGVFISSEKVLELRRQSNKPVQPTTPLILNNRGGGASSLLKSSLVKEKSQGEERSPTNAADGDTNRSSSPKSSGPLGRLSIQHPDGPEILANNATAAPPRKSKGLILFCNPNAAFYETISQQEFEKSWMGFYVSLGYDVFFFNYRGYGRSTGAPTPANLRDDGNKVMEFLLNEFCSDHNLFILHGESIGGMIACSIAANYPKHISALICDRTFASLDATASRLMGNWAGNFMRFGAFWNTCVIMDYLNAPCKKLILQDPNDEIIYESASLKAGVASKVCLNDSVLKRTVQIPEYNVASHLKTEVPNSDLMEDILSELGPKEDMKLTNRFIWHFYYCCLRITYLSSVDSQQSANADNLMNTDEMKDLEMNNPDKTYRQEGGLVGQIEKIQRKGGLSEHSPSVVDGDSKKQHVLLSGSSSDANLSDGKGLHNLKSSLDKLGSKSMSTDNLMQHPQAVRGGIASALIRNNSMDSSITDNNSNNNNNNKKMRLEDYLNMKLTDKYFEGKPLNPFKKVYAVLFRTDNGCDYLLGSAFTRGLDFFQSWITCYLCWNGRNIIKSPSYIPVITPPPKSGGGASKSSNKDIGKFFKRTVLHCIQDLKQIMEELHPNVLSACNELIFIIKALEILFAKNAYFSGGEEVHFHGSSSAASSSVYGKSKSVYGDDDRDDDLEASVPLRASPRSTAAGHPGDRSHPPSQQRQKSVNWEKCLQSEGTFLTTADAKPILGDLLPLHTGHNGWLHSPDLKLMKAWLTQNSLIPDDSKRLDGFP